MSWNRNQHGEGEVAQSCLTLCDPWTVAYQAPLSMGFSRQEYWSGLPFPSPGDLPDPGIKPRSPTLQVDALTSASPGKPQNQHGDPQNPQKALMAGTREQGDGVLWDQVREVNSVWRRIWVCEHWVWLFFMFCHYSSIRNQILLKVAEKTLASQLDLSKISDIQNFYYAKNKVRGLSW